MSHYQRLLLVMRPLLRQAGALSRRLRWPVQVLPACTLSPCWSHWTNSGCWKRVIIKLPGRPIWQPNTNNWKTR